MPGVGLVCLDKQFRKTLRTGVRCSRFAALPPYQERDDACG
jgi:hypothetical protein